MRYLFVLFPTCFFITSFSQVDIIKTDNFEVSEYVFDFGHIKQMDGDVEHKFEFKNTTNKLIQLDTLVAECGCTISTLIGVNKTILPDSSVQVPIKYEASTHPSFDSEDFFKKIVVYTSVDTFEVAITGYVLPNLEMKDYENVKEKLMFEDYGFNFGNIYHDATIERGYNFYNMFDDTISLDYKMTEVPNWISVSILPEKIGHAQKGKLIIRYDPKVKNDWSFVKDYIKIKFSAMQEPVNFIQSATILERFDDKRDKVNDPIIRMDTLLFDIGSVTKGDTMSTIVTVYNDGKSPLIVRKIDPTCSCIKLKERSFILPPKQSKKVELIFYTRKSRTGTQRKKVYFISNDPNNPLVTFDIKGKTKER